MNHAPAGADRPLEFARDVVERAISAGADAAEVYLTMDDYLWIRARKGAVEKVERAVVCGFGLKVLRDHRKAYVTGSDLHPAAADRMIAKALAYARATNRDRHHALPARPRRIPRVDTFDPRLARVRLATKLALLSTMEEAAYAADRRVKNTQEADYSDGTTRIVHVNSHGLSHQEERTSLALSISVVAQRSGERQVGSEHQRCRFFSDLDPVAVGREAGQAAAGMLGARPVKTVVAPVVLDNRVTLRLLYLLSGALNGELVLRGESFLKDRLGAPVAAGHVTIRDDPRLGRGFGDMSVDGEGVLARSKAVVDRGVLTGFYHNLYSASRAGCEPTGNVIRPSYETEGGLAPANVFLEPGTVSRDALITTVDRGLYVNGLIGSGFNHVTGDYSVGATGFWIEGGRFTRPVERVTIAANLRDVFLGIEEVASDLRFWGAGGAPTVKVRRMSIGGE